MIVTAGLDFAARLASEHVGKPMRESRAGLPVAMLAVTIAAGIGLCVLAAKFWRTSLTLLVVADLVILGGVWAPAELGVVVAVVLVVWRWRWPESFRRHVVPPVRAWLVRWGRYAPRWAMLTSRHVQYWVTCAVYIEPPGSRGKTEPPVADGGGVAVVHCSGTSSEPRARRRRRSCEGRRQD